MTTKLDLAGVLMELGVEVTGENEQRVFGLCPRHEEFKGRPDSKPSWSMDKELLVHHCWSCPYAGTLRELIVFRRGDKDEASEWLADHVRQRAIRRFRDLPQGPEAPKSVSKPQTALQRRMAGFSDPPDWMLEARGLERFAVVHYGLRWDPDPEHWIIPIHDEYGKLVGFQRKSDGYFKNVPKGLQKKFTLFGLAQFVGAWAVLLESPLDVVRLYSEGVEGGVSSFGAYVSNYQLDLIIEKADEVVLALDNDEAGNEQRNRVWHAQMRRGKRFYVLDYTGTNAKDIGDMTSAEVVRHAVYPRRWKPPAPATRPAPKQLPPGTKFMDWRRRRHEVHR